MKKPYMICHMMMSVDGRIPCIFHGSSAVKRILIYIKPLKFCIPSLAWNAWRLSVEVRSTLLSSMPDYWIKSAFYSVPESMVEKV